MKKFVAVFAMLVCLLSSAMAAGWSTFITDPNPTAAAAKTQLAAIGFTQAQIDYAFRTMGTANAITMARVSSLCAPFKDANLKLINLGLATEAKKSILPAGTIGSGSYTPPKTVAAVPAPSDTELAFKAAYNGDYASLLRLLVAGNTNVNASCPWAVWKTFERKASKVASDNYIEVNSLPLDLNAPLISYVAASKFSTAQKAVLIGLLIKRGANVNAPSELGKMTPIFYAVTKGDSEIVKMLLQLGADPRALASGVTWQKGTVKGRSIYEYLTYPSASTSQAYLLSARATWFSYTASQMATRIAAYKAQVVASVANVKV